jgi:hypothetical protein
MESKKALGVEVIRDRSHGIITAMDAQVRLFPVARFSVAFMI